MYVEQAIFTSLRSERLEGYQLAAASAGVVADLAKELERLGPAHDSLLDGADAGSINFYKLAAGDWCVARTVAAGEEYSGRGTRIYTQSLIVPPAVLARFSNNPFAIIEAASASQQMPIYAHPPATLDPVRLLGRASPTNAMRLAELLTDPGLESLTVLLNEAIGSKCLAVRSHVQLDRLYHGLFMLLPVRARLRFSLSTGLRFSPRRDFRLVGWPVELSQQRELHTAGHATLLDLDAARNAHDERPLGAWAALVNSALQAGKYSALTELLRSADSVEDDSLPPDEVANQLAITL
jgi:hypothetical protein